MHWPDGGYTTYTSGHQMRLTDAGLLRITAPDGKQLAFSATAWTSIESEAGAAPQIY